MKPQNATLKEKASHGSILLPFEYYHCVIPETFDGFPLHWHEEVEFTYVEKGSVLYYIDLNPVIMEAGDIILLPPHTLHSGHIIENQPLVSHSFVFHLDMLGLKVPDVCSLHYFTPLMTGEYTFQQVIKPSNSVYHEILTPFMTILDCVRTRPPLFELSLKQHLFSIFTSIYQYNLVIKATQKSLSNSAEDKVKAILTYIEKHYMETITIEQLANSCHFSESYFIHFFKKTVGMTCIEYINNFRLDAAGNLLKNTSLPIMEIAFESGFENVSYFNRLFKKKYKISPKLYRK